MKRGLKKISYISISVAVAVIFIYSALPYYCITSLKFPGWNIYWDYGTVQRNMGITFIGLSGFGALSTLKKKNTVEDVVINIGLPLAVLLFLKVFQYHIFIACAILGFAILCTVFKVIDYAYSDACSRNTGRKRRGMYYIIRRRMTYILLFALTPMALYVGYRESSDVQYRVDHKSIIAENEIAEDRNITFNLVSESAWDSLTVESRFSQLENYIAYLCQELNVGGVTIYTVKELTDGTLAYYTHEENAIYLNVVHLSKCSMREALHICAHEMHHKYANELIEILDILEESEISTELEYWDEILALKEAKENYYTDSLTMEGYTSNLLEVRAEQFAHEQIEKLEELNYFSKE